MGLLLLAILQDAALTRGPYLQNVTATSIAVCWRTETETEGVVEYGETATLGATARGPKGTSHAVELRDLKPDTRYRYRVGRIEGRFRTAPPADAGFTFVLYGDGRGNRKTHERIAERIAAAEPDLVVNSGDLVADGLVASQWDDFFRAAAPMLRVAPFYSSLGNHDRSAPAYFESFVFPGNERYYSFDYGAAHFVVLDSNEPWRTDERQAAWLNADLAASKARWKFAIFHHPMHSTSPSAGRVKESQALWDLWGGAFEKGGVTVAMAGHNHNYQRAERNGVTCLTSGGGGAPLYPLGKALPETKAQKAVHHFVRFVVEPKRIAAEAVDADGGIVDRFTIEP